MAATDVNGDGRDDLVLGAGPFGGPEVLILDALSLAQLDAFFAFDLVFRGGGAIGGAKKGRMASGSPWPNRCGEIHPIR